jgi:Zn finger protein HypA/HybF involved in hydrogenase expression
MPAPLNVYSLRVLNVRARCECRVCGRVRFLEPEQLGAESEMHTLDYLARRFKCLACGRKDVTIEPDYGNKAGQTR